MKKAKTTLLEQIKSVPTNQHHGSPPTDPEVAIAWLKGEVTLGQVGRTLWPGRGGNTTSYTYTYLVRSLREAYRMGMFRIVE